MLGATSTSQLASCNVLSTTRYGLVFCNHCEVWHRLTRFCIRTAQMLSSFQDRCHPQTRLSAGVCNEASLLTTRCEPKAKLPSFLLIYTERVLLVLLAVIAQACPTYRFDNRSTTYCTDFCATDKDKLIQKHQTDHMAGIDRGTPDSSSLLDNVKIFQ